MARRGLFLASAGCLAVFGAEAVNLPDNIKNDAQGGKKANLPEGGEGGAVASAPSVPGGFSELWRSARFGYESDLAAFFGASYVLKGVDDKQANGGELTLKLAGGTTSNHGGAGGATGGEIELTGLAASGTEGQRFTFWRGEDLRASLYWNYVIGDLPPECSAAALAANTCGGGADEGDAGAAGLWDIAGGWIFFLQVPVEGEAARMVQDDAVRKLEEPGKTFHFGNTKRRTAFSGQATEIPFETSDFYTPVEIFITDSDKRNANGLSESAKLLRTALLIPINTVTGEMGWGALQRTEGNGKAREEWEKKLPEVFHGARSQPEAGPVFVARPVGAPQLTTTGKAAPPPFTLYVFTDPNGDRQYAVTDPKPKAHNESMIQIGTARPVHAETHQAAPDSDSSFLARFSHVFSSAAAAGSPLYV
ncbi:unnamed protein product [Amoebophrya sp. A120]|nr:unnamed protein product [Amoebophrya sp. A120]|eukprot:GSA120T00013675001.1